MKSESFNNWHDEVVEILQFQIDCDHGDAEAIAQANESILFDLWSGGKSEQQAADVLENL